ncbi:hypothetical protein KSP39_PZI014049 [Platanthera zijinensis]|uniref:CID domain-containing protein n=1 Tax=Platanthera zijinensis TaxID=2320716 RepID=A0AAP0BD33_9ASPA
MDTAFSTQILNEKLSKLNNSQQSIESLSNWCINQRKKARQIVEIWEQLFSSSSKEQMVPFLYLANDIIQNSRRKGSEFVNEFWKVLPGSLKGAYENGEENIKNSVMRLVDIWDERKVFGSRGRGLKDDILGIAPPTLPESNGKSSNPIKLVKKDPNSIRIKLAVGGMPEKIVSAYQAVLDEHFDEDTALNKCKTAVRALTNIGKEVNDAYAHGSHVGMPLKIELEEQEDVLRHCILQLRQVETKRSFLVTQLKDALQEQESKLDLIRTQLQVAQTEADHAINIQKTLASVSMKPVLMAPQADTSLATSLDQQPVTSSINSLTSVEDETKKAAAVVAAKLAASTSSAQMLTSILSSLVAEEAASLNTAQTAGFIAASAPLLPLDKRPKLEKPMSFTDMSNKYFGHVAQHQQHQPMPQNSQSLQSFPTPPPLPSAPPPSMQSYMHGLTFGFSGNSLPPPPPLSTHASLGAARPNPPLQPPPPSAAPPQPKQQQQQSPSGFYPSPGIGYYAPPVANELTFHGVNGWQRKGL